MTAFFDRESFRSTLFGNGHGRDKFWFYCMRNNKDTEQPMQSRISTFVISFGPWKVAACGFLYTGKSRKSLGQDWPQSSKHFFYHHVTLHTCTSS